MGRLRRHCCGWTLGGDSGTLADMKLYRTREGWQVEREGRFGRLPGFDLDRWLALENPPAQLADGVASIQAWTADGPEALLPLGSQEVWAAGVTYQRSRAARMEESDFSATAYDRVYDAPRPEIFFKATPRRCAGPGRALRLRDDSRWNVPEPELALVVSARGQVAGFTIGDDLSSRDIEGENLLYLPQAKVWDGCCALGPCILVNTPGLDLLASDISIEIRRGGQVVFSGSTPLNRMKRSFGELIGYLFRNQSFPEGVVLLTGTGIVPGDDFTLRAGDVIDMAIPAIGCLTNPVE
jgi:2-dehydro-3-deoxy-D-arabinonate dehydratase